MKSTTITTANPNNVINTTTTPNIGEIALNTSDSSMYVYDGTKWEDLTTKTYVDDINFNNIEIGEVSTILVNGNEIPVEKVIKVLKKQLPEYFL